MLYLATSALDRTAAAPAIRKRDLDVIDRLEPHGHRIRSDAVRTRDTLPAASRAFTMTR
jgi:hypothetical protein